MSIFKKRPQNDKAYDEELARSPVSMELIRQPQSKADCEPEEPNKAQKDKKRKISKYENDKGELVKSPVSAEAREQIAKQRPTVQIFYEDE
ncbi:MAG: hypothetical protein LVQ97_04755 [Candidatus Micrarchaeales archaeon]|jgi:hypothetical protein|nr:hypothetical protein [Candidatus Micrarchaeales archaeon]